MVRFMARVEVANNEIRRAVARAERAARQTLAHCQVSPDRIGALSIIDIPAKVS
jgi:hypothetical protein